MNFGCLQNVCDLAKAKYVATVVVTHVVWTEDGKCFTKIICEKIEAIQGEDLSIHSTGKTEKTTLC